MTLANADCKKGTAHIIKIPDYNRGYRKMLKRWMDIFCICSKDMVPLLPQVRGYRSRRLDVQ